MEKQVHMLKSPSDKNNLPLLIQAVTSYLDLKLTCLVIAGLNALNLQFFFFFFDKAFGEFSLKSRPVTCLPANEGAVPDRKLLV